MKRKIRLTESDLHNIIKESVKKVLNEEIEINHYVDLAKKALPNKAYFSFWRKYADIHDDEVKGWLRMSYDNKRLSKEVRDAIKIVVDNYDSISGALYNLMFNDVGSGKQPPKYYDEREQNVVDPLEVPLKDRNDVRNGNWNKYNPLGYRRPSGYYYP